MSNQKKCKIHLNYEYQFVCTNQECNNQLVCSKCITIGGHIGHIITEIPNFIQNETKQIAAELHFIHLLNSENKSNNIAILTEMKKEIETRYNAMLVKITKVINATMQQKISKIEKLEIRVNEIYNSQNQKKVELLKDCKEFLNRAKDIINKLKQGNNHEFEEEFKDLVIKKEETKLAMYNILENVPKEDILLEIEDNMETSDILLNTRMFHKILRDMNITIPLQLIRVSGILIII